MKVKAMCYLFYGLEEYLIQKEIHQILTENGIESISLNQYDLENSSLKDIIEDASTISLFGDKKAIVVEQSYIFAATTNKKLLEQDTSTLEDYLLHPNPDTILILKWNRETIDQRKKIVSKMKQHGIVRECNKTEQIDNYVKEMLEPYHIDMKTLRFFIERVGKHLEILKQEAEKLKTYKGEELNITKKDIEEVTCKTIDVDIFNLIEHIVTKEKELAMESYYEMIKLGEEPIKIIILLANQFRLMYQAKLLSKRGYSEKEIASRLEIHPYRVKLALSKSKNFQEETLLQYIEDLAQLDLRIKGGKLDKNIGLELFILQI